jgi:hypothetical protein
VARARCGTAVARARCRVAAAQARRGMAAAQARHSTHTCSPPAHLHRGLGRWGVPLVRAHDSVVHRDTPMGCRLRLPPSTTVATFLYSDGFFRSMATTTSHLSAWPTVTSSSFNAWIWAWRAQIWVVDFFIFKKRFLLSVGNNRYHKGDVFRIGQIVSVVSTDTIKVLLTNTAKGFYSSATFFT